MACGCPVILSDILPHKEIADGQDFIPLVPPDNVDGFSREIERMRSMSRQQRFQIGLKCRKLIEEKFSLTSMCNNYHRLYREVIRISIGNRLSKRIQ